MTANLYIIGSVLLGVLGQMLLKAGVDGKSTIDSGTYDVVTALGGLVKSPYIVLALGVYAAATVLWLMALSVVDLSYAFPFVSLSVLCTAMGARAFLGETVSLKRGIGIAIICMGLLVIAVS